MRKGLFYYSQTGNTELVCRKIRKELPDFELVNLRQADAKNLTGFDLVGFASSTWNLDLPVFFRNFLESLPEVSHIPAFIVITYSVMEGRSIKNAGKLLENKGFRLFDYHSIKTPDSFPPFRKKGVVNEEFPDVKELNGLNDFINRLRLPASERSAKVKLGFWNAVIKGPGLKKIRKDFGQLKVDREKCTGCGICSEKCDYGAISCSPEPQFHMDKCLACYGCFNNCPERAIFTDSVEAEYACGKPGELVKKKLA